MSDAAPDRCAECGTARAEGTEWCPRCLTRYEPVETRIASGPIYPQVVQSRTAGGPMTFGPIGRAIATTPIVVVLGALALDAFVNGNMISILFLLPGVPIGAYLLRDVWRPTPKHVAPPPTIRGSDS